MKSVLAGYFPDQRLFEAGWDSLSDVELLTLMLSPGTSARRALRHAERLMECAGSTHSLEQLSYLDLRKAGLTHKRALGLQASVHFFRRMRRTALFPGQPFRSSLEIFRHFQAQVEGLKKECFWNVLLDGKNRILKVVRISEGSLTSSLVHPREVFRPAIREAAAGVLFVHNHPSGDPAPSPEDIQITRRLVETGKIVGIRALDHVIIGACKYFSFADQGML